MRWRGAGRGGDFIVTTGRKSTLSTSDGFARRKRSRRFVVHAHGKEGGGPTEAGAA
jgi:hypothetical protein